MTYQGQDWLNAWPIGSLAKRRYGTTAMSEERCAPTRYGGMMRRLPSSQAVRQRGCEADAKSWGCPPDTGPLIGAAHEHARYVWSWSADAPREYKSPWGRSQAA